MSNDDLNAFDLAKKFAEAVKILDELDKTDLSTNSSEYQV